MYQDDGAIVKRLKVTNANELLLPALEKALLPLIDTYKDYFMLTEFLENGPKVPNQKSLTALYKNVAQIPPLHPPKIPS